MKLALFALTIATALAFDLSAPALNPSLIAKINSNPKSTWKAGINSKFEGATLADVIPLMGTHVDPYIPTPRDNQIPVGDLPEEFDSAEQWPDCKSIPVIRDQSMCGSCWAISSAEVMSDRWCIATRGKEQPEISTQDIVSCFDFMGTCKGCEGGNPAMVFMMYWPYYGAVTGGAYHTKTTCYPYEMPECEHHTEGEYPPCNTTLPTPKCAKKCTVPGFNYEQEKAKYKGKDSGTFQGEEQIMNEVMKNGPVVAAFHVYQDFLAYKSGIYQHDGGGQELGGHAVKIVGWGEEDGVKFWKIANSWNTHWGEKGYFRIIRGQDECGIESYLVTAGVKAK